MSSSTKVVIEYDPTIAKRYKLNESTDHLIKQCASLYGSQSRALQVATEFLIRMKKPIAVTEPTHDDPVIGMTYKLIPRTVDLIERLTQQYGKRGRVLAACAQLLSADINVVCQREGR